MKKEYLFSLLAALALFAAIYYLGFHLAAG